MQWGLWGPSTPRGLSLVGASQCLKFAEPLWDKKATNWEHWEPLWGQKEEKKTPLGSLPCTIHHPLSKPSPLQTKSPREDDFSQGVSHIAAG